MGGHRRRRRLAAIGLALMLAGGLVLTSGGSSGAETGEGPAAITREAYFTNPASQVTPPLIRKGFPPATACLVAGLVGVPQLCGPSIAQLAEALGLSDGLPIPVTPDQDIAQLVLPGTTPIGMLGGQQRYTSLFQFALPPLPAGEGFTRVELVFHQDGLNIALESPAVRDIVLQVVSQLEAQDPAIIADAITRALTGEVPLLTQTITGIEACPLIETWAAGGAQGAALDGTRIPLPAEDCRIGSSGEYDPAARTWTFDVTVAAQSWTTGANDKPPFPNEGILLRPAGAPNLAYGDPDLSTNWIVSLANTKAAPALQPFLRYETGPLPTTTSSTGPVINPPPPGGTNTIILEGPERLVVQNRLVPVTAFWEIPGKNTGTVQGWVWLGLPLLILGALLFGHALAVIPRAVRRRPGALTRLIEIYERTGEVP